jgi:hypothetical protein
MMLGLLVLSEKRQRNMQAILSDFRRTSDMCATQFGFLNMYRKRVIVQ